MKQQQIWNNLYSTTTHTQSSVDWVKSYSKYFSEKKEHTILDLGCGRGDNAAYLFETGYKVVACDFSPAAIEYINKMYPQIETRCFDMIKDFPNDLKNIGIILASLSTHYFSLEATTKLYDNIYKTLEPGGYFIFRVNSKSELENKNKANVQSIIEDDYYMLNDGNTKRYFDKNSISMLLKKFKLINVQETEQEYRGSTKYFVEGIAQKACQ